MRYSLTVLLYVKTFMDRKEVAESTSDMVLWTK